MLHHTKAKLNTKAKLKLAAKIQALAAIMKANICVNKCAFELSAC